MEFAVDLTAAGIFPSSSTTCQQFVSSYAFTQPGNGNSDLEDYIGLPPLNISNCSTIQITKATNPAVPDPPATFQYDLDRVDGGPVQDTTPPVPPDDDANPSPSVLRGSLTVPGSPTDSPRNIVAGTGYRLLEVLPPPAPWSHLSVACNYFNPLVLDANLKATPATVTLTNANGTWSGQTFPVAPPQMLPAGVTNAATARSRTRHRRSRWSKQVVNTCAGRPRRLTCGCCRRLDPAGTVDSDPAPPRVSRRAVAPGTYTLAEAHNTALRRRWDTPTARRGRASTRVGAFPSSAETR